MATGVEKWQQSMAATKNVTAPALTEMATINGR